MASMSHLYAVIPVSDIDTALPWYEAFFGRIADEIVDNEFMWSITDAAWVVVTAHPESAGGGLLTLGVSGLDEILARLDAWSSTIDPIETYANGVRHVVTRDPDGNRLSLAEAPSG